MNWLEILLSPHLPPGGEGFSVCGAAGGWVGACGPPAAALTVAAFAGVAGGGGWPSAGALLGATAVLLLCGAGLACLIGYVVDAASAWFQHRTGRSWEDGRREFAAGFALGTAVSVAGLAGLLLAV